MCCINGKPVRYLIFGLNQQSQNYFQRCDQIAFQLEKEP